MLCVSSFNSVLAHVTNEYTIKMKRVVFKTS